MSCTVEQVDLVDIQFYGYELVDGKRVWCRLACDPVCCTVAQVQQYVWADRLDDFDRGVYGGMLGRFAVQVVIGVILSCKIVGRFVYLDVFGPYAELNGGVGWNMVPAVSKRDG